jgi:hypothetical protein
MLMIDHRKHHRMGGYSEALTIDMAVGGSRVTLFLKLPPREGP